MKKWLWVLVVAVVALGVGGYSYSRHQIQERSYAADMQTGRQAIKAKKYTQAENAFTRATRTKASDTVAQRYLSQTQTYVAGTKAISSRQFTAASDDFNTVISVKKGSDVLVARAKTSLSLVKTIVANRKTDNKNYQKALELNQANEFTDSNGVLTVMFQSKTFSQSYYKDIYRKAKGLQKENNAALKSLTGSTPITDDATESATTGATSTSESSSSDASTSSQQASQSASNSQSTTTGTTTASSSTSDHTSTTGGSADAAGIQATREELNEAGLNAANYTDAQIQAIMQKAAAEHTSPVQAALHSQQWP